jgi:hypothetical protein
MALPLPEYIRTSGIQDVTIRFRWDDWNVEDVDMPLDEALQEQLHGISYRAVMAFTILTAEWIVHRFGRLLDDPFPGHHLEAAWAQVVDFRYAPERDIILSEWAGPIRGPVGIAVRRAIFAVQQAESCGEPAWRAGRAVKLAEHVIADTSPYHRWREGVIERMIRLYPWNPDDRLGEVVPREALDLGNDFKIELTEPLVNRFLGGLDWTKNPFLNPPSVILGQGFLGEPYRFRIDEDRKARFEW